MLGGIGTSLWYTSVNPVQLVQETVSREELARTDTTARPTDKALERARTEQPVVTTSDATARTDDASPPPRTFAFTVIADAENYATPTGHNDVLPEILAQSAARKPAFGVFSGDIVTFADPSNTAVLTNLKTLIEKHYAHYYIAYGLHDLECGAQCFAAWQKVFFSAHNAPATTPHPRTSSPTPPIPSDSEADKELEALRIPLTDMPHAPVQPVAPPVAAPPRPYHTFDYEQTHFILLSSDYPLKHGVDDAQLAWLENDLKAARARNIIVFSHVPPVTFFQKSAKNCHDMSCDEPRRKKLVGLFERYGVDLVISGHEHAFDHKIVNGIHYVLAGNSGNGKRYKNSMWKDSFLFVTVEEKRITVQSYLTDGTEYRAIAINT